MLNTYQQLTRLLLSDASFAQFNDFDLAAYINQARLQVASQGRCVRAFAALPLIAGQQIYPFAAITTLPPGVSGVFHIRQSWLNIPGVTGQTVMYSRPFEWFSLFALNQLDPAAGQPQRWSQYQQGVQGSIFVDPVPDLSYTLTVDTLGVPNALASDTDVEAIPMNWTLAVPFYAAWYGFQTAQLHDQADKMLEHFTQQMALARNAANPDLLMENWPQAPDPEQANRLGVQQRAAAGNA